MSVQTVSIGEPFFHLCMLKNESAYRVREKTIVLNLSPTPIHILKQRLGQFQSAVLYDITVQNVERAVVVSGLIHTDDNALLSRIRQTWPTAFAVRGEQRLRGVAHYMSPKLWLGRYGFTFYHAASVPLNVGLHQQHDFCPVPGFREVHTQIIGFGKMQQCRKKDTDTLYLEEPMAPGGTHRPMYDENGNYPWHQFETITPSVILAVEMLPAGAGPPADPTQSHIFKRK